MGRYGNRYGWRPYVSVAKRRQQAAKKMQSLRKKGVDIQPVEIQGRLVSGIVEVVTLRAHRLRVRHIPAYTVVIIDRMLARFVPRKGAH